MKAARPETLGEARRWETVKNLYVNEDGLCFRCAAQMAWGHSGGFATLPERPCEKCAPIVARFPVAKANGWRAYRRGSQSHSDQRPDIAGGS